jgi:hypothetical protein
MASLATEDDLHNELLSLYTRTGEATGYWAHYFLRGVFSAWRGPDAAPELRP